MNKEEWQVLVDAFRILAPVLGGYAVYLLKGILKELRLLNDRVVKIEDWQKAHDEMDDLRFANAQRQLDALANRRPYESTRK